MATDDDEVRAAIHFLQHVKRSPVAQTKLLAILSAAANAQRAKEQ